MNVAGNERKISIESHSISEQVRKRLGAKVFPPGSVIFPKVGGAIATDKKRLVGRPCCVDNNIMGAIPRPGQLHSGLLYQLLLNKPLTEFANDAGLPSIRKATLENWMVRVPVTTEAQEQVAMQLDLMASAIGQLADSYTRKLAALAELKQSLLARAFSGELTANDALAA